MTPDQAVMLYREMFSGEVVGLNHEGETAEKDTPLAAMLRFCGARCISWNHHKWSNEAIRNDFARASEFLRQWADQIDAAGKEATE